MAKELFDEEKQVAVIDRPETEAGAIVRLAVEKDLDVDKLERLLEMKKREEERIAKQEFDSHFTAMQKDFPPVRKTKGVKDKSGSRVLYKYCPLEDILTVYAPIIADHGFSYRWTEEALEGNIKRIWCIISGYGHEEKGYVDIPIQEGNSFTNAIQQRGVSTSYGKRYSFVNALGIIIEGEDDEQALSNDDVLAYADFIKEIQGAATMDALGEIYRKIYKELSGDRHGQEIIIIYKDKRKKELSGGTKNA